MTHIETHIAKIVWTVDGKEKTHHVRDHTQAGVYTLAHMWAQGRCLDRLSGKYKVQYVSGFLTLSTDQVREGDVILHHGMRILIDGPARVHEDDASAGGNVYSWPGLVTNADEICDKGSEKYDPYIACHIRGQWREDQIPAPRLDEWRIVGKHGATWTAELRTKS